MSDSADNTILTSFFLSTQIFLKMHAYSLKLKILIKEMEYLTADVM